MAHFTPAIPGAAGVGGLESVAQRQDKINAACDSFIRIGFRPKLFTIQNLHDHGYTDNDFLEYIKLPTSITDLEELASVGVLKFSTVPEFASLRQFIQCVEWLKSEEGRKDMADKARRMNVEKKAKGELTPADIALAHAFAFDESVSGGKITQPGETSHSKRARTGKQPEQSLHGGSAKIL